MGGFRLLRQAEKHDFGLQGWERKGVGAKARRPPKTELPSK
jgi:hypothetical protein